MSLRFPPRTPQARRRRGSGSARRRASALLALLALLAVLTVSCADAIPSRMAVRILDRYRKTSGAKPLTAGGMIRIRLERAAGAPGESGREEILWEPYRFRDTVSSAGLTTVRGIESGRAYFIDGDGVTRVASEPVLRELVTRSYFWRRAWLFEDRGRALLRLGPADGESASVQLDVVGGNPLVLAFARSDGRLLRVRSPRFDLDFHTPARYRDVSDPAQPFEGEVVWTGLPTGLMPHTTVGGGRATFGEVSTLMPATRQAGSLIVDAQVLGKPVRLAVDGAADGPLRLSPKLAENLALKFATDVFGRRIASGATLRVGAASWPGLFAQIGESVPDGADAVAGACLFREAVIEIDLAESRFGLHDPARWVVPEGFVRIVTDDDDDRPVAVLRRGSEDLRLTAASDTGGAGIVLAASSAERAGLAGASDADELRWGPLVLSPLRLQVVKDGFFPAWGDDGRLGFAAYEQAQVYIDMPQRWTYVQPRGAILPPTQKP